VDRLTAGTLGYAGNRWYPAGGHAFEPAYGRGRAYRSHTPEAARLIVGEQAAVAHKGRWMQACPVLRRESPGIVRLTLAAEGSRARVFYAPRQPRSPSRGDAIDRRFFRAQLANVAYLDLRRTYALAVAQHGMRGIDLPSSGRPTTIVSFDPLQRRLASPRST